MAGIQARVTDRSFVLAIVCLLMTAATACEPWGKPGPEEKTYAEISDFRTLYNVNCSGCHGMDGKMGPGRILNDVLYLSIIPKDTLQRVIENGRPGTSMPAWSRAKGGPLSAEQITALVDGIEANWAKQGSAQPAAAPSYEGQGTTGDTAKGMKLFARDCFMCHGPGARVGLVTDPAYLSLVTNQMLRTSIIVGRPDLGMPDYRFLNMGRALNDQDVSDLVAYLVSKRPADITAQFEAEAAAGNAGGQQTGATGAHEDESGSGQSGTAAKGNEGSGYGPGSPQKQDREGNKSRGSSRGAGGEK